MRGINYRSLVSNWESVIDKLCEEVTPFDVMNVVLKHVKNTAKICEDVNVPNKNLNDFIQQVEEALKLIDPEG